MGQGFHSKVIYGVVLDTEQSDIYADLPFSNTDLAEEISNALGTFGLDESYDVRPIWIGFVFASTDFLVAKMKKCLDISGGVNLTQFMKNINNLGVADVAKEKMPLFVNYLNEKGIKCEKPDFYLVTDYH